MRQVGNVAEILGYCSKLFDMIIVGSASASRKACKTVGGIGIPAAAGSLFFYHYW